MPINLQINGMWGKVSPTIIHQLVWAGFKLESNHDKESVSLYITSATSNNEILKLFRHLQNEDFVGFLKVLGELS